MKSYNLEYIKIKIFCLLEDSNTNEKASHTMGEDIYVLSMCMCAFKKGLIFKIYKESLRLLNKKRQTI